MTRNRIQNRIQVEPIIQAHDGSYLDLRDPQGSALSISNIAHALSNVCRFAGHTREFYSVAQHSYLVSKAVLPEFALQGLLHDAAEAYVGDITTPLKNLLVGIREMEGLLENRIWRRFGFTELAPCVKSADLVLLATERRDLMTEQDVPWRVLEGVEPLQETIIPLPPKEAYALFMRRYKELRCK